MEVEEVCMRKFTVLSAALLALFVPAVSFAQSAGGHVFISVNGLGQAGDSEVINRTQSSTVYGESATVSTAQSVSLAAGVLDVGGGFRMNRFGVGVAFTTSTNTDPGITTASIPHPFLFNRPRTSISTVDALEHKERVVHLQAYYFMPLLAKAEIGLFVGPSFYSLKQDYVTGSGSFTESSSFETVTVPVTTATASDSQLGYNIGAEATYRFTPNVGVAALLRFTRASAELDLGGQPVTMNVGDVQFGGGVRFRF
jgi:hypothetical protein